MCKCVYIWLRAESVWLLNRAARFPGGWLGDDVTWAWASFCFRVWRSVTTAPVRAPCSGQRLGARAMGVAERLTRSPASEELRQAHLRAERSLVWDPPARVRELRLRCLVQRWSFLDAVYVMTNFRAWQDWAFVYARRWDAAVRWLGMMQLPGPPMRRIATFLRGPPTPRVPPHRGGP